MDRDYNQHSFIQQTMGELLVDNISIFSRRLNLRAEYRVADFGCGPGGNSVKPLLAFLQNKPDAPLSHAYMIDIQEDPELWNQLESTLTAAKLNVGSYPQVKQSFYLPLTTDAAPPFLDMAWSCASLHWSSRPSSELEDYFSPAELPEDSPERARWAADADADWRTFLRCRAAELVPGG